ncbi:MAG TPA: hypothetical protein VNK94_09520 [Gaiellaceae bacterium]|nr:hypothetical protein [Gaiellaceae bacterium]
MRVPVLVAVLGAVLALAACGGGETASTTTGETVTTTGEMVTTTGEMVTTTEETVTTEPAPAAPVTVRIEFRDGRAVGGIARPKVEKGDRVVLVVTSDVADEVHLHGYDLSREVAAGGTARIRFRASVPGRFEVELEERGVQIAELTVTP